MIGIRLSSAFAAVALLFSATTAVYEKGSPVQVLSASEWKTLKDKDVAVLVEFYSPQCGHCVRFAPAYEEAAKALKGIAQVVAVEDRSAMAGENISGFPTVRFVKGKTAVEFKNQRTALSVVTFVTEQITKIALQKVGGKTEGAKTDAGKTEGSKAKSNGPVIELTDGDFEKRLKEDPDSTWFVLFYAPWCGHCKSMMSDWKKAATELSGKVFVAQVDSTVNTMLAEHFQIKGFPSLFLFPPGTDRKWSSLKNIAQPFNGGRDTSSFVQFAMQYAGQSAKLKQLTSESQFVEECSKGVCLVAFLPHILDSKVAGRNKELEVLTGVMRGSFSMPIRFLWSEGGSQFDVEEALRLQFGFPAVVAVNFEKKSFSIHKGSFEASSLRSFITGMMAGRVAVEPIPQNIPGLKSVDEWDGKEGKLPDDEL